MWIFVHSFVRKSNVKDRKHSGNNGGGEITKKPKKRRRNNFTFLSKLPFDFFIRPAFSSLECDDATDPYFLFFFAIWVYESCKNGL